jgi:hypothetical protein
VTVRRILPLAAIAVVVGGLIWAFVTIGTPRHARLAALDRIRIANLYEIARTMHDRFGTSNGLPATLPPDLKPIDSGIIGTGDNFANDPISGAPYEYRRIDQSTYRLCATFALSYRPMRPADRGWKHPSGRTCFQFDVRKSAIDPDANGFDETVGGSPPF